VPSGLRPVAPVALSLRMVGTAPVGPAGDTLWRLAPLGPEETRYVIPAERFLQAGGPSIPIAITSLARELQVRGDPVELAARLEPEGSTLGFARFVGPPRLRVVYTIPQRPELP
jgi:hypothetical protein